MKTTAARYGIENTDDSDSAADSANPRESVDPSRLAFSASGGHEQRGEIVVWSYGLRIAISVYDPVLMARVFDCLPDGWKASAGAAKVDRAYRIEGMTTDSTDYKLNVDGSVWCESHDLHRIFDVLESDLQIFVAEFAEPFLFVHAGVVQWRGATIVLPGASYSGKSTLVTALVHAGALYLSDEFAVFNEAGEVHAFPRRLSLREGPFGPARRLDLRSVGTEEEPSQTSYPVDLVLFATYIADAVWTIEAMDHGPAILALCRHTVAIQRRPAEALAILSKVAERGGIFRATRGDLESPLRWLEQMIDRSSSDWDLAVR